MAITLWAGASAPTTASPWTVSGNRLPSPDSMTMTQEEIWNADAGRNAKGEMIATFVAQKYTYAIKWGVITYSDLTKIRNLLTNGFFRFTYNSTPNTPPTSAGTFYRSEITYELLQAGGETYYKDVTVSVIQK